MADKCTIVVFSGDIDKVFAAFTLATTAASMGMETEMFFTFWGLNILRKPKRFSGRNLLQKMMNLMNRGGAEHLPLSKFNLLGLGPAFMKIMMKQSRVPTIPEMLDLAKQLKVKILACTTTFSFMGYKEQDFLEGSIDKFVGAAYFLGEAKDAKVSYFI
ncbi:MAG: DsrE/DsrF/DrsH-like family protein [Candidatus Margulisiibacteriota bacterium]